MGGNTAFLCRFLGIRNGGNVSRITVHAGDYRKGDEKFIFGSLIL